ncbi:hypothetical protein C4556_00600 [Candidatus Parcubacteria bacterium]|nr:MAG: hypothetical protein C4556_00600 [Candidatus Parcubacteria bacterium]
MTRSVVAISLGAVLLTSAFVASLGFAQAESVVWTSPQQPRLEYRFNNKGTWLDYFIATIKYQARIVNADTGVVIPSGTGVAIGSRVRIEPIAHARPDIYWYGTGGRYDSPYGEWITNAGNPDPTNACTAENFFKRHDDDAMFGLLSVQPPTKNISTNISGSSFSCDAPASDGTVTCTANSPGAMNATVNFASTYGNMYLAANEWRGTTNPVRCDYPQGAGLGILSSNGGPYQLSVPAQSVPFSIISTYALGQPPSAPVVSALSGGDSPDSTQCVAGSSYGLTIQSTDPDGQQIRYYIDWNGDGFVDQIAPSSGYVASGTSIAVSRTYSTGGNHSIRVQATDESGLSSAWTTYSFTCADEPGIESQEEGTGGGGTGDTGGTGGVIANLNLRAVPSLVRSGETTRLFWSAGDVAHCDVTGTNGDGGVGWDTLVSPVSGKVSGAITEQTTFTLSCYTFSEALVTDTATVNILPQWSEQ